MKFRPRPLFIAFTGPIVLGLFLLLPISSGYELALAYVPMFFIALGVVLAGLYWLLAKITNRELKVLYYIFLFGNLIWGSLMAIDMAFDTFQF